MIELLIYEKARKKRLIIYFGIGIFSIIALFLFFPTCNPLYFILPILILPIIISISEPKEKPGGTLSMSERQITIKTKHTDIKLELDKINKLKLIYSGFKGRRLPGDFMPRFNQFSGNDNYISIDLGTEIYEYRFCVENEIKEKQIIELISNWERYGFDVSNITLNIY